MRIIKINAKCSDMFSDNLFWEDGKFKGAYEVCS